MRPSDPDWYEKWVQKDEEKDKRFRRKFWSIAFPFIIFGIWVWINGSNEPVEPIKYEDLTLCEQMRINADPMYDRYCLSE